MVRRINFMEEKINFDENLSYELKKGLYNWYPFEEDATIIYAMDGEIEHFLGLMDHSVDYVVASYLLEKSDNPTEALKQVFRVLKPEGHLLLGCENRLGLRFFCGDKEPFTGNCFDGLENYANYYESDKKNIEGRLYADYEIKEFLKEAGFDRGIRYSILPGLEMPQQFYVEGYYPQEEIEIRYTRLYHNPETVFLYEEKLYDSLIKNGTFHQMVNAYLYDCSVKGDFYNIDHVTTSMDRGPDKAMATILEKSGKVIKKSLYPKGNQSLETLIENTRTLEKNGIDIVPVEECPICNDCKGVSMPYIKGETALSYLRSCFKKDKELFKSEVERFIELILKSSSVSDNQPDDNELGLYYDKVFIDMVPLNCFYEDGKFVFYDQEYVIENFPINVLIIRAIDIIYMNDRTMLGEVPISYFFEKYGLSEKADVLRRLAADYIQKLRSRDILAGYNAKHLATFESINTARQKVNYNLEQYIHVFADILKGTEEKDIYIFGSGLWAKKFVADYGDMCKVKAFLDNSKLNQGKEIQGIKVISPDEIKSLDMEKIKVVVCVKYYATILIQLKKLGVKDYGIYDPFVDYSFLNTSDSESFSRKNMLVKNETTEGDAPDKPYKVGYIAGVFDLFHIGHLNMFKRAKEQCEYLIVGVVSDEQASSGKKKSPYINEKERLEIVQNCRLVDEAHILPKVSAGTKDAYKKYHFDVQFSGSDYEHDPEWLAEREWLRARGADIVFFPYTQSTSSTKLKEAISKS